MKIKCLNCQKERRGTNLIPIYNEGMQPTQYICNDCIGGSDTYDECDWCKKDGEKIAYEIGDLMEEDDGTFSCINHRGFGRDIHEDE